MPKRQVFFSFHYNNDVMRVQQIRNIGVIEGNSPISANSWETIRKGGDNAIKKWIDDNMKYRSCIVVLVGADTANRKWVQYEIAKAWEDGKGVVGICIHNIKCPRSGISRKGKNPFTQFNIDGTPMHGIVKCYNPDPNNAYSEIAKNLEFCVEEAIKIRNLNYSI